MTTGRRFWGTAAGVAAFVLAVIAAAGTVVWFDLEAPEQAQLLELLTAPRIGLLALFLLALIGGIFGIVRRWFRLSVEPVRRLAEATRLIAASNPEHRLAPEGCEEAQEAAAAVNALAQRRGELQREVEATVQAAKASVEAEKNRLAALMSELRQSVLVCNREGRILLYNAAARALLARDAEPGANDALVGLGRSVFGVIDRSLIQHALDSIGQQLERGAQAGAQFVTTTPAGGLLRVQAAPVLSPESVDAAEREAPREIAGFVLLLSDVTETVERDSKRVALMQALGENTRSALANIRAAIENLIDYPDMDLPRRERFAGVIRDEAVRLSERLNAISREFSVQLESQWPLEDMRGEDLIALARSRIEKRLALPTKLEEVDPQVWVKVDSFSLAQGITYLAARLKEEFRIREVRFRLTRGERHGQLDLLWRGAPLSFETVFAWENDPFEAGGEASPLTWKQVVARHAGEAWYRRDLPAQTAYFRLLLPLAAEARSARSARNGSRPEFYDFDLFELSAANTALDERPLSELTSTVPAAGGDFRPADRSAPAGVAGVDRRARDHPGASRWPAGDRCRSAALPPFRGGHGAGRAQRGVRHALPPAQGGTDRGRVRSAAARHTAAFGRHSSEPGVSQPRGDRAAPGRGDRRPALGAGGRAGHRRGVPAHAPAARRRRHPDARPGPRGGAADVLRAGVVLSSDAMRPPRRA
jgi:DNA polymerase-3 subunit epsilon